MKKLLNIFLVFFVSLFFIVAINAERVGEDGRKYGLCRPLHGVWVCEGNEFGDILLDVNGKFFLCSPNDPSTGKVPIKKGDVFEFSQPFLNGVRKIKLHDSGCLLGEDCLMIYLNSGCILMLNSEGEFELSSPKECTWDSKGRRFSKWSNIKEIIMIDPCNLCNLPDLPVKKFVHKERVRGFVLDGGEEKLISYTKNKIYIWDIESGKCQAVFSSPYDDRIYDFLLDQERFFLFCRNGKVYVMNILTGECLLELQGHEEKVLGGVIDADRRHLFTYSDDLTIRMWEILTGECLRVFRIEGEIKTYPNGEPFIVDGKTFNVIRIGAIWLDKEGRLNVSSYDVYKFFSWKEQEYTRKQGVFFPDSRYKIQDTKLKSFVWDIANEKEPICCFHVEDVEFVPLWLWRELAENAM